MVTRRSPINCRLIGWVRTRRGLIASSGGRPREVVGDAPERASSLASAVSLASDDDATWWAPRRVPGFVLESSA